LRIPLQDAGWHIRASWAVLDGGQLPESGIRLACRNVVWVYFNDRASQCVDYYFSGYVTPDPTDEDWLADLIVNFDLMGAGGKPLNYVAGPRSLVPGRMATSVDPYLNFMM